MDNNEAIDEVKTVEKIDMTEVEAERMIQDFYQKVEELKNDHEFLRNCEKYREIKNKDAN